MAKDVLIDHLFRHQYGKMVSILTRIFGLSHLETIEDAVQDTFILALSKWRHEIPNNPEAWLTQAAKNRTIDLFRKLKSDQKKITQFKSGPATLRIDELFLAHEIEDSQLRMIFTACHPKLNPKDQIAFALKTIAGFSIHEIASALLLKEATVKKRLHRARNTIKKQSISFSLPNAVQLKVRLERVHEILYLIFNEGFHSNRQEMLIRKDLCGEAIRLCKMVLKKEHFRTGGGYALFALLCFHAARLESKISSSNTIISLKHQDRSQWYSPLIELGHNAMLKTRMYDDFTPYHIEASIAAEHLKASSFETTDWLKILQYYQQLYTLYKTPFTALNMAIVYLQLHKNNEALNLLQSFKPEELEQRSYLYYGAMAEYYYNIKDRFKAIENLDIALAMVTNKAEKEYLEARRKDLKTAK